MSLCYKLRDDKTREFMSPHVFRRWLFSWMSNQNIEFRQPCKACGPNPKVLGGDGTKIGSVYRNIKVTPIEQPAEKDVFYPTLHRRNDRCFLSYRVDIPEHVVRLAREGLMSLANHIKGKCDLTPNEIENIVENVCIALPPECVPVFQRFVGGMCTQEKKALADIYKLLATTAPLSAFIPLSQVPFMYQLMDHFSGICIQPNSTTYVNAAFQNMRQFAPELRNFLAASINNNNPSAIKMSPAEDVIALVQYILGQISDLELTEPMAPVLMEGTYNPAKYGRAYYFTNHGNQLRHIRQFSIDVEKSKGNHDDYPQDYEHCRKEYAQISVKGTSHLFLWFCAQHGHCYGFHIIPGSEGRKDPFASLYTHMEAPPDCVYYDFACNLHEYCLNRESGFFKNVQFFHDIFHGYSHKCSDCYRSSRLLGFEAINSEICEQFNSFIQLLKYTVRQMSQVHFVFYLQYFIHVWNQRKASRYERQLLVALAGTRWLDLFLNHSVEWLELLFICITWLTHLGLMMPYSDKDLG